MPLRDRVYAYTRRERVFTRSSQRVDYATLTAVIIDARFFDFSCISSHLEIIDVIERL